MVLCSRAFVMEHQLSKWWLKSVAFLLATTPPTIVLCFRDSLAPYFAKLSPLELLQAGTLLLLTATTLFAYILLQRPWLEWDEPTGTWVSRFTGVRYCTSCRTKKIMVPLKTENAGWRCMVDGGHAWYPNPGYVAPKSKPNLRGM